MRATSLDGCGRCTDKPLLEMLVYDFHYSVHTNSVLQGKNLDCTELTVLKYFLFKKLAYLKKATADFIYKLVNDLIHMRDKVSS